MIEKLIDWCTQHRFMVMLVALVAVGWGYWAVKTIPLDAIPDISDTQVVIYAKWMQPPQIMEDQVAYPIVIALLGAPKVKSIRAQSDFGNTYVYIIFEDGTDIYWARSRVLEYMSKVQGSLPKEVQVEMGPDASGVGWVYQYALVDRTGKNDIADMKSYQDWNLKFVLQAIPGVAEVATVGGITLEYQVEVNPNALAAYGLTFKQVMKAVRASNRDVGGRLLEMNGREYMIQGLGYVKAVKNLENVVVGSDLQGVPVVVRDIGRVQLGPGPRRGVSELDGEGEVVGGIVTMRYGENALDLINRVKAKIEEVKLSLPEGMEIVPVYDRSELIEKSVETLTHELLKLAIAVSLVCVVFLWHFPSAMVIILTLPVAILMSFTAMRYMGVSSNIMSLAGIAIAIGGMVDATIILVENACTRLEQWQDDPGDKTRFSVIVDAAKEVAPALFHTLLVVVFGFLPVFALQGQEGRLFSPLAYTWTFSMFFSAVLAITVAPVLMTWFLTGRMRPDAEHPLNRWLHKIYGPCVSFVLKNRAKTILVAVLMIIVTIPVARKLGSEFMPPLWEGDLLYMPATLPGISVNEAARVLQMQDQVIKAFPEVKQVYGKAGRAETSLDPAPLTMIESILILEPREKWRKGMTKDKLIRELDKTLQMPGFTNAWTMPIKTRIDMLSTGIRTPIGIKVLGEDLDVLAKVAKDIEKTVAPVRGTLSAYAERVTGGFYVNITTRRTEAARYGLTVEDLNEIIEMAVGGQRVTTTVQGRERYAITVRYTRDTRDSVDKLERTLISTPSGNKVQLGQVADISVTQGPGLIRDESGLLAAYVYVDVQDRDIGSYLDEAKAKVEKEVKLPPGVSLMWSGQYENMQRAKKRFIVMVPLALVIILFLIYQTTKSATETFIVLLAVPFSLVGAVWLLYILDYNLSVAVWVGMIALAGLDAETGVVMLLYLTISYKRFEAKGEMKTTENLRESVMEGAVKRIRPKMMTVGALFFGLLPVMMSDGIGSDVMKRIAAPMVGGVATSFILELLVYPVIFMAWKWHTVIRPQEEGHEPTGFWGIVKKIG